MLASSALVESSHGGLSRCTPVSSGQCQFRRQVFEKPDFF